MPSGRSIFPLLVIPLLISGCAGNDLMLKRQSEAEAKIEFLIQSSKKAEQRHNDLTVQLQTQEERLTSVTADLQQVKSENRELRNAQDELGMRVPAAVQQSQTPKIEVVNQPSPHKATKETGPPAEYLKAFGLYSANNFQAAIESFDAFIKNFPQSDYAANALYWTGECYYTLSELTKARDMFSKVAEQYPKSQKTPDALLKLGYTLAALKEKEKATAVYEKVITTFPSSPAAAKAREKLNAH